MDSESTFKELVFSMIMTLLDKGLLPHLPVQTVDSLLELLFCNLDENISVYQRQARHCLSALVDKLSSLPSSSQESIYKALLNKYLYASLMYIVLQLNSPDRQLHGVTLLLAILHYLLNHSSQEDLHSHLHYYLQAIQPKSSVSLRDIDKLIMESLCLPKGTLKNSLLCYMPS